MVPSLAARAQEPAPVEIRDDYFSPVPITINIGDSVTWTVYGDHPHSVTADAQFDSSPSCLPAPAGVPVNCMSKGDQFTVAFNTAGTYSYHCRVHGSDMVGSVVVESANTTTSTTTSTTVATTTSTSDTTTTLGSDQPTITQASLPAIPTSKGVAQPKSTIRSRQDDDLRPWVLLDVGLAGTTTMVGIVLVRRGRVRFG